jgi:hypothetical protein
MGWFRPSCQLDAENKAWIDRRFTWLSEEFGLESIWKAEVILPTHEYFPDPYDGSEEAAESLFDRVCGYMHVDRGRMDLCFYSEDRPGASLGLSGRYEGTAGLYEPGWRQTVRIESSNLDDPTALVAAMAHELGHVHLLGDGHISPDAPDHEPLTDLLTVYFGMGIFTANSVIRERNWRGGGMEGWSIGKLGYLTAPMYAYAFALFAWARGEHAPAWAKHLRLDVRSPLKKNLRYLIATKDSDFKPSLRK